MINQAELKIVITAEGQLQISGPIHDKMTCYAMLEGAKDAVREYNEKAASPIIQPSRDHSLSLSQKLGS